MLGLTQCLTPKRRNAHKGIRSLYIFLFLVTLMFCTKAQALEKQECFMEPEKAELVRVIWNNTKNEVEDHLLQVRDGTTSALYNTQVRIQNLLTMAIDCENTQILEELSEILYGAFVDKPFKVWANEDGKESVLHSSQFLYAVAVAVNAIADFSEDLRTPPMEKLAAKASDILSQYYHRWIFEKHPDFSTEAWGCNGGASLRPTGGMTYSAWVRVNDGDLGGWIVGITDWTVLLRIKNGKPEARVYTDSQNILAGTASINDGAWHHVALVFKPSTSNASGVMRVYVDGVLDSQRNDIKGDVRSRGSRLYIGGYPFGDGDQHLRGTIDEVHLYSKALSGNEIQALNGCAGRSLENCPAQNEIVAHWNFENGGKDTVGYQDLSRGGFNLPLTSNPPKNDEPRHPVFSAKPRFGNSPLFNGKTDFYATHEWGHGTHTHRWHLIGKLSGSLKDGPEDPDYCHAVRDQDMWIIVGLTELLSAHERDPNLFEQTPSSLYSDYLNLGLELIESRTSVANGRADFDVGAWDEHQDFKYSGYFGDSFPENGDMSPLSDISWDIGHSIRFVHVFRTLNDHRSITGSSFPDENILESLANQYADAVFNGDFMYPSFSNYFNGTNGWYRVGFHNPHFGYGPSDLSSFAYTGGYGFWARYNPVIKDINNALWDLAMSTDPTQIEHRKNTFGMVWDENDRGEPEHQCLLYSDLCDEPIDIDNSLDMLMFLPVFSAH